jgi:Uma2 family endonuclease
MNVPAKRMTVPEFLVWAEQQPRGRFELVHGQPIEMAAQRVRHGQTKHRVANALEAAIGRANLPCLMLPDGLTVRVDEYTAYEPDALVYCGPPLDGDELLVPDPVIVVEVMSPSTKSVDTGAKLVGYFKITSVQHYLIIDALNRSIIHHARAQGGAIETRIVEGGNITLEPPGMTLAVAEIFR